MIKDRDRVFGNGEYLPYNDYKRSIKNQTSNISKRIKFLNSISIAFIICANYLSIIFDSLNLISNGFIPILIAICIIFSYSVTLIFGLHLIHINKKSLFFLLFIIGFFLLTILFNDNDIVVRYFTEFLGYGLTAFMITLLPFNPSTVLKYLTLSGLLILLNPMAVTENIGLITNSYGRIDMGSSYALLVPVSAAIIYFFREKKGEKISLILFLSYLTNIYMLFLLLSQASRGTVISLLVLLSLLVYKKVSNKFSGKKRLLSFAFIGVFLSLSVLALINITKVLYFLYSLSQLMGIEIAAILKTYNLVNNYHLLGLLNGRQDLYLNSLEMIKNHIFLGNGIGSYTSSYGIYPHNIVLQLMVEGGIVLTIPVLIIITGIVFFLLTPQDKIEINSEWYLLLLLLFSVAMPRLMFSSYLWQQQSFWLMIFVYFIIRTLNKKKLT
ncbi:O-antigen ligase [Terribacillus sp. 7520-G]|uniref:O-antigen ligase family protein n=1 Tax=Terribacillus sp. 7520-G TaxID=2025389 RepID=UPI000BA74B22|nr:O-antigen ligase family protein [Terribacillus sp. 7520-G]PAD40394.1 hypothetical protein CHH53_00120 [Terribacillus sp. 7520-G]